MEEHRFDGVARRVATSTSRRQVLTILGGAAVGTLFGTRAAFAKNTTCAQWCAATFGETTIAAEQCAGDAAHQTGLCYSCGPQAPGGGVSPSSICCTRNSANYCASYSGASCCSGGQTCVNGQCSCTPMTCAQQGFTCGTQPDGCGGTLNCGTCPSGQDCQNGVCTTCSGIGQVCTQNSDCCNGVPCNTATGPCAPGDTGCSCHFLVP
jgi:hypothetical protein